MPKTDLYTKTVLTVIAAALVAIAVRPLYETPRVAAQQQQLDGLRVVLAGYDLRTLGRGIPVNIMGAGENNSVPVTLGRGDGGSVPVNVVNTSVPVTLGSERAPVPVNIVNTSVPVAVNGNGQDGRAPVRVSLVDIAGEALKKGPLPVVNQGAQVQSK